MAFKTTSFSEFMDELLAKLNELQFKQPIIIITDNVAFHKNVSIREKLNQENRTLMFLPQYSPFLNPVENLFSKWKLLLRQSNPTNEQHLLELIKSKSSQISKEDCILTENKNRKQINLLSVFLFICFNIGYY